MKANELMIGDWVCYDGDTDYSCPIKIEGMDVSCGFCITSDRDDAGFNGVIPIPLTAEILKRNGFERKVISDKEPYYQDEEGNSYYQYGDLGINTPHIWFWYKDGHITMPSNCTKWIELSYVHELQHALRLCELDTLADNFKV